MGNLLKTGMEWLAGVLEANASEDVVYTQDGLSVTVPATYGHKLMKLAVQFDGRVVRSEGDFIINAATLTAAFAAQGATFTAPKRGATIAAMFPDGTVQIHEVSGLPGEPHFQLDDFHLRYRIHTKKVS